jgi:hypothetical protein
MRFRVRNRHSIRDVRRLVRKKWSSARERASMEVRHEALQPQTIVGQSGTPLVATTCAILFVAPLTLAHRLFATLTIAALQQPTARAYCRPLGRIPFLPRSLVKPRRPTPLTSKNAAVPAAKPVPAVASVQPSPCGSRSENIIARMAR